MNSILIELRELRTDFNREAREAGERMATMENQIESIAGGKQPGRLSVVEGKVFSLEQWRWTGAGIYIGVSSLVSGLTVLVFHFWK